MNFSAYSIKNPLVAILLFTLLTLGGLFAFKQMKIQQFPEIDLPGVVVTVTMSGASPEQLESDVAKKVEAKLANIQGIKHIRTTVQTGAVTFFNEFTLEKELSEAVDDVRSAVSEVKGELPAAANDPIVSKVSTAGFPVVGYSIASTSMTPSELSWWVDDTLGKRLADLEGVGQISRLGGIWREVTVLADPQKLSSWQLPITHLSNQVAALWADGSGGEARIGNSIQTIRIVGAGGSLDELKNLQIQTAMGPAALSDVAQVNDGAKPASSLAYLGDQSVVAIRVTRSPGASEVNMVGLIDQEIQKIEQQNPTISIQKIYDYAEPIHEDYKGSLQMLIEGCVLAVIVVLVFLKNWRATFVAAAALPLSIIPTFLAMHFFGFSLNVISLLALSLVIGVLVDDAIVEVENIVRHLHMGKTPYEAAMEAADEIGLAVIATTFTLIAVFLPTAFMKGVVGQFFSQFGWTASIAIFVSLVVARLITPMMAAYILKPQQPKHEQQGKVMRGYLSVVNWTLRHRALTLLAVFVLFVLSLSLVRFLPTTFIPDDDSNQTQVSLELTPDARIHDTELVAKQAAELITKVQGVRSVFVAVGSGSNALSDKDSGHASVNTATLSVALDPRGNRPTKTQIEQQINQIVKTVAGARFTVGLAAGGESGYSFSLTSSQADLLDKTVQKVVSDIGAMAGVSVTTNQALPKPELVVIPDRLLMAQKGVSSHDLTNTLRVATLGDYEQRLAKMNFDTRQIPIVLKLSDQDKANLDTLEGLYMTAGQQGVQVGEVAKLELKTGVSEVRRLDKERAIKITVNSSLPLGELASKIKATPTLKSLPDGIRLLEEGQAENMKELFSGFVLAMGVGIICIFGTLMLLFHRVLQPFTILVALPLSIGGAFIGLIVTGSSLSMPSMIGFIMLMGIATKNSILLVDYAVIAQNTGKNRLEAIMDACSKRARPVVMTTIAMGAGMLPLIFGWGGSDTTFRRPMAAAVLGGLITSTFLSLVVVPVVYTLMDELGGWFKKSKAI